MRGSRSTTQDVTSQVTWSSSDTGIATISNASGFEGVVTGGTIGSAVMTASLSGVTGSTTVTVTPSVLQQLQVTPANPFRPRGLQVQFTATGLFSDGSTQDMTSQVTWTSSDVSVVPVSNTSGAEGRAVAQNVGSATFRGVEIIGGWQPTKELKFGASFVATSAYQSEKVLVMKPGEKTIQEMATERAMGGAR